MQNSYLFVILFLTCFWGELSSNSQVSLHLVKGRFKCWTIVFLIMEDNLNEVNRLDLVDFPMINKRFNISIWGFLRWRSWNFIIQLKCFNMILISKWKIKNYCQHPNSLTNGNISDFQHWCVSVCKWYILQTNLGIFNVISQISNTTSMFTIEYLIDICISRPLIDTLSWIPMVFFSWGVYFFKIMCDHDL